MSLSTMRSRAMPREPDVVRGRRAWRPRGTSFDDTRASLPEKQSPQSHARCDSSHAGGRPHGTHSPVSADARHSRPHQRPAAPLHDHLPCAAAAAAQRRHRCLLGRCVHAALDERRHHNHHGHPGDAAAMCARGEPQVQPAPRLAAQPPPPTRAARLRREGQGETGGLRPACSASNAALSPRRTPSPAHPTPDEPPARPLTSPVPCAGSTRSSARSTGSRAASAWPSSSCSWRCASTASCPTCPFASSASPTTWPPSSAASSTSQRSPSRRPKVKG